MRKSQPDEPLSSPIPFQTASNGEYAPLAPTARDRAAEEAWRRLVDHDARRLGVSRRDFVRTAAGSAAALLVINQVYGCGGKRGEGYAVDREGAADPATACEQLRGPDFVFDVQTHHVDLGRDWHQRHMLTGAFEADAQGWCAGESNQLACWSAEHFIREVFVKSDTTVACLTLFPAAAPGDRPLLDREAAATREIVDRLARSPRLLIHGMSNPELGLPELEDMQRAVESSRIAAWKVYPQFGGWRLDDPKVGLPFLEQVRRLGIPIVAAHKGLSFPDAVGDRRYGSPADVGPAAKAFPDLQLLVYHAGYEAGAPEGPYDPEGGGVDRLVRSVLEAGIAPGGNVFAELGSTWRLLMTRPIDAAHVLGKLMVALGEDNVLWGTDSLWHGTPQGQIEAFRAFQIPPELQEKHGYPALTPERKAKILGLSAARVYRVDPALTRCAITEDDLARRKAEHATSPAPRLGPVGPRTRRDLLALLSRNGPGR